MKEYYVAVTSFASSLDEELNGRAKHGWSLHSYQFDTSNGAHIAIMERDEPVIARGSMGWKNDGHVAIANTFTGSDNSGGK